MDQDPQDPDAGREQQQAAQQAYPPPYTGQTDPGYQGYYQAPPPNAGGPYGPQPGVPYGYPYGYPYPPVRQATNTLAILALVFGFVFAPAAIVMGIVARRQIRRSGEEGMGLATAGLVLGIVFTALTVIWFIVAIAFFATAVHNINQQNGVDGVAAARAYLGI